MKSVGIITIHKINNYGSVLQAYALQKVCMELGFKVEIIDYQFPNSFHTDNPYKTVNDLQPAEPRWIKLLFARALIRQHRGITCFVSDRLNLSECSYDSPEMLEANPPVYDVYITGSDQVWSPRYCNGDPSFMLHFSQDKAKRISYASSIGSDCIPPELEKRYIEFLSRYDAISVREKTGVEIIKKLTNKNAKEVLDPTLLLDRQEWNELAVEHRLIKQKYILCYFLNYTFNAFPYADELAADIQRRTGYRIVRVARPPHRLSLKNTGYEIGASPEEFLALVRDAEIVLTTSFHGTAFALNYGRPVFTIVQNSNTSDSRQANLMREMNLEKQIVACGSPFPGYTDSHYDVESGQKQLEQLRIESRQFLINSLGDEQD